MNIKHKHLRVPRAAKCKTVKQRQEQKKLLYELIASFFYKNEYGAIVVETKPLRHMLQVAEIFECVNENMQYFIITGATDSGAAATISVDCTNYLVNCVFNYQFVINRLASHITREGIRRQLLLRNDLTLSLLPKHRNALAGCMEVLKEMERYIV